MNAILHHCSLPTVAFSETELSEGEEVSDDESSSSTACETSTKGFNSSEFGGSVRPGIVHRLDKGTSGLLVVAKVTILSDISTSLSLVEFLLSIFHNDIE